MTFLELQDRVMSRLNLSETAARDRVKIFINERYRRVATSISLGRVRRGTVSFNTAAGTYTYTPTNLIKPFTVTYVAGSRVLDEMTLDQLRLVDPNNSLTGGLEKYAVTVYGASTVTLYIHPKPDAIYALQVDGMLRGTDLSANGDIPAFPEDFHDVLEFGALADELEKMEKYKMAEKYEKAYAERQRELRYFIAKSAYLELTQGDQWWIGPWYGVSQWY